jgi:acyl-CoA synthetase (AMP-forming)/AMP-acid ligase II
MGQHQRQAWFGCACCPSNICRFIPSLPGYVYAVHNSDVYVNLFMGNTSSLTVDGKSESNARVSAFMRAIDVSPWLNTSTLSVIKGQGKNGGEGCVIFGRSDATINRHGLRMGTSELYSAVEALPEVIDSMVVDLEYLGRESYMPLFVVLRPGLQLTQDMKNSLNNAIKTALSPRFVPNEIFQVAEIPRTLSGKKQELPIKKLMLGQPLEKVVNKDAMANPACLTWYVELAKKHLAKTA